MKKLNRRFWPAILSTFVGFLIVIVMLEVVLRFFPVRDELRMLPVNRTNPVVRFRPDHISLWSTGWNFSVINRFRTNNYGFVSDTDYDPESSSPLLAIIGDSYMEAAMLPYDKTGPAQLAEKLRGKARVYSFAAFGSPLSQYLAYARYARNTFHPNTLVVVIVRSDFDESLMKYKSLEGFHYFVEDGDGELALKRVDYAPGIAFTLFTKSALVRYLLGNVQAPDIIANLKSKLASIGQKNLAFLGNAAASTELMHVADSKRAVDAFLRLLPGMSGLNPTNIVLVVDGIRPNLYDGSLGAARGSYFDIMRRYLMAGARSKGFEVIDMQQEFLSDYKKHGHRFEFPSNSHWNAFGHEVFVNAVARSAAFLRLSSMNN